MLISKHLPEPERNALIDATLLGGKGTSPAKQPKGRGTSMQRIAAIDKATAELRAKHPELFLSDAEIAARLETRTTPCPR